MTNILSHSLAEKKLGAVEPDPRDLEKRSEQANSINDLIDDRLLSLEQMLDARGDANLEIAELKELRQLCFGLRALMQKVPGLPE